MNRLFRNLARINYVRTTKKNSLKVQSRSRSILKYHFIYCSFYWPMATRVFKWYLAKSITTISYNGSRIVL